MTERFFLIYVVKYCLVTQLPSLPDCYLVIYYPALVLQSLLIAMIATSARDLGLRQTYT